MTMIAIDSYHEDFLDDTDLAMSTAEVEEVLYRMRRIERCKELGVPPRPLQHEYRQLYEAELKAGRRPLS